jgi:hypothetical protein
MSKVIYTAIFGNYEELKEPAIITPGWRYICYTDQPLTSNVWEIVSTQLGETTASRAARWYKVMHWIDWELSIWIDASFRIAVNLNDWWDRYFQKGFSAPCHPWRNDVYNEALDCILSGRGIKSEIEAQIAKYRTEGIPSHGGIISSGLLMRQNTPDVIALCEDWWHEVANGSTRDQIAFAKVSLNHKPIIHTYQWDYRREKDFIYHHHYNRR